MSRKSLLVFLAIFLARGVHSCSTDLDCQLNGICSNGQCQCDKSWTGASCGQLNLLPTPKDSGFHDLNASTWGGNIINGTDGIYHMWIAEMDKGCGLTSWGVNSLIRHVTSESNPTGPYVRQEVIVPNWSHNPIVLRNLDGTLLLYHIGTGTGSNEHSCPPANGTSPCGFIFPCLNVLACPKIEGYTCYSGYCSGDANEEVDGVNVDCGSDLAEPDLGCSGSNASVCATDAAKACDAQPGCQSFGLSNNWNGANKAKLFSAGKAGLVSNSEWAVWVKDGASLSEVMKKNQKHLNLGQSPSIFDTFSDSVEAGSTFPMHYAKSEAGPWIPFTANTTTSTDGNNPAPWLLPNGTIFIIFNDGGMTMFQADTWQGPYRYHSSGACGGGEDPYLFQDKRGNWHCLFHRSPFSNPGIAIGHAYSLDAYNWIVSSETAASSTIVYEGFGSVIFAKRERPKLRFDEQGNILHFISGVCILPECDPFRTGGPQKAECTAEWQYPRCDQNYEPGYYDSTFTHVQAVNH